MLILAAVLILAVGCKENSTAISSILDQPDKYVNHEVLVGGNVTKSYGVNLFIADAGAYQIDDGTGKIWVISRNGVPNIGEQVGLKGTVASGMKLGGQMFGAVIREQQRQVR